MKRTVTLLLAAIMVLSIAACGKKPAETADPSTTAPTTTPTTAPTTAPTEAPHTVHTFGDWSLQQAASCAQEGREERRCTECNETEVRAVSKEAHRLNEYNICKNCRYVEFDKDADFVELGVVCAAWYGSGRTANYAWDVKIWDGKLYRGAGDFSTNSGATVIPAYDIANQRWDITGTASDEAIQSFEEIGGTLYAPGIDATEGWDLGNFYVLKEGKWEQVRNLPNGLHNFDMIEHEGEIFAGLGTESAGNTVAVSRDGGKTFQFVPLYKDSQPYDLSACSGSRTYEFTKHNGKVYALIHFTVGIDDKWEIFCYEDGKMHYLCNGSALIGSGSNRKLFCGEFEFGGACYFANGRLTTITDFSNPETWKKIPMPGKELVRDVLLWDGVIYVLATLQNINYDTYLTESHKTVIYKSTTGQEGSFEEVMSFDYCASPMCFDYDGTYFYIGTGASVESAKTGMVLRVNPQ